jgi:hypothetical protein
MALNTEFWQQPASGYEIEYAARFDESADSWLNQTFANDGTGDAKIWTISTWIKMISDPSGAGQYRSIISAAVNGTTNHVDQVRVVPGLSWGYQRQGGIGGALIAEGNYVLTTNSWNHIVVAVDTNQGTDTNRTKMYFNGTLVDDYVSGSANYGAEDFVTGIGQGRVHGIGKLVQGTFNTTIDAYMAEFIFVDGVQHAPTKFGESSGGSWVPIDPSEQSITFGTNGFWLKFAVNDSLGTDSSGNGNDWTVNNMGTDHRVTDTPTS